MGKDDELSIAAEKGDVAAVKRLLGEGANVNAKTSVRAARPNARSCEHRRWWSERPSPREMRSSMRFPAPLRAGGRRRRVCVRTCSRLERTAAALWPSEPALSVSYTHLTLPTKA